MTEVKTKEGRKLMWWGRCCQILCGKGGCEEGRMRSCELVNSISFPFNPMVPLPAQHKQRNVLAKANLIFTPFIYMHT
jgi:hypothetical protein